MFLLFVVLRRGLKVAFLPFRVLRQVVLFCWYGMFGLMLLCLPVIGYRITLMGGDGIIPGSPLYYIARCFGYI